MAVTAVERAPKNYSTLLAEVRGVLEADRAKYGEKILSHLEEEIGLSQTLLGEIHLFYRSFPISPARGKLDLPWTDYRLLLRIKDPKTRMFLAKEAVREHWTTRELALAVRYEGD